MCGFAGYKAFHKTSIDHEVLHELSSCLEHRGPDDAGIWTSPDHQVALISRRLSIVDISKNGSQPMWTDDQSIILVFNGEIYNYAKLRGYLESQGHQFHSDTDTEVLLRSFQQWGISCLERLDGMFAGAIYDRRDNSVFLFRDRMGIKPLYFSLQSNMVSFASEIKALWKMPWNIRRVSMRGLSHYLTYLATPAPMTLFDGIYKLPAGYFAKIDKDGNSTFVQWYDPLDSIAEEKDARKDFMKKSYCVSTVRRLLKKSVQKRLIADVPVGALLSGGLDSSLIVALMAQQTDKLNTFTVSFENDPNQERAWARKVAKKFGTDHHELILTEQEAFSFFGKMPYYQDEPLGDAVCIPLYFVSKLARDAGMKVLLTGEGSDELFCGYPMYVDYLHMYNYWKASQHYIPDFAKRTLFYAARPFFTRQPNRQDLMRSWAQGRSLFWGGVRVFSELWKQDILSTHEWDLQDPVLQKIIPNFPLGHDSYAIADFYRNKFYSRMPDGDFFAAMSYIELKHRLPELLLTRTDKMSMAASIEARVPYMDQQLVQAALQIPMKYKYRSKQTKYVLKKAAEGIIPHDVIYRKKVGFSSPVIDWFKNGNYFYTHLADMLRSDTMWRDCLDTKVIEQMLKKNRAGEANYAYQLWAISNLLSF